VDKISGLDFYPGPFYSTINLCFIIKVECEKNRTPPLEIIKTTIKSIIMKDQDKKADSSELEKSKAHIIVEIIEYMTNSVVIKTIIKKSTGNISVMSFDSGEGLTEKTSPFDTFVQILEGKAEIVIDKESNLLESGQGIIIPAHSPNFIKPNGRFKMISTIIKSGYE
jgi:quercetin dioxygenase-like cupin family protein